MNFFFLFVVKIIFKCRSSICMCCSCRYLSLNNTNNETISICFMFPIERKVFFHLLQCVSVWKINRQFFYGWMFLIDLFYWKLARSYRLKRNYLPIDLWNLNFFYLTSKVLRTKLHSKTKYNWRSTIDADY